MKNIDEILYEIREAAFRLEEDGADPHKIIILSPKKLIDILIDEFEKKIGDRVISRYDMNLFGYKIFPSFENIITVYDEDIAEDLGRFPIKIKMY